jgi:hypothetical protein
VTRLGQLSQRTRRRHRPRPWRRLGTICSMMICMSAGGLCTS